MASVIFMAGERRHPVGHHRVWIETDDHVIIDYLSAHVTRWVTTGCGLKLARHSQCDRTAEVTRWVTTGCGLKHGDW